MVALLLAGAACGGDDVPEVTPVGDTTLASTGPASTGVEPSDPDSTSPATMGADATQGEGSTDAPTTGEPTTGDSTTGDSTTDDPSTGDGGPVCGNGIIEADEQCDGEALGGEDCATQGFLGGALGCSGDCTLDTSRCVAPVCGNGTIEGGESCDGADLGGESCQSQGFDGGVLACAGDCTLDASACTMVTCGNGVIEAGEVCDGASLGGQTCVLQGFGGGGVLACAAGCAAFDTSGCLLPPICGNGVVDAGEVCDGADLGGETCVTQGFFGGSLWCAAGCGAFDTGACIVAGGDCCAPHSGPGCDDAACEAEICAFDPFCCATAWDDLCAGAASSSPACVGAGGTCPPAAVCGDGLIEAGEACDGANLGGQSCASLGFGGGGVLVCALDCSAFVTAGCNMGGGPVCGNGAIEIPEVCDGGNLGGQTCISQGFGGGGALSCAAGCGAFDTAGCIAGPVCGDGVITAPEVCDGASLGGQTCISQGFGGGGVLGCAAGCGAFNTAGCIAGGPVFPCADQDIGNATGPAVAAGNTAGSDNDLQPSCGGAGGNDHVVQFTAMVAGSYTFDTFGSGYDTKLALYSDCATQISCNDDAGGTLQSQLVLNMAAGQTVLVVIDGYNGATGNFVLNITPPAAGGCAHPLCQTGGALVNGCDPCVTQICAVDPFCCNTSWDGLCVNQVTSVCGLACP
jgi:hypothetical protein